MIGRIGVRYRFGLVVFCMRNVGLLGWRLLIRAQPLESRGETLDIW